MTFSKFSQVAQSRAHVFTLGEDAKNRILLTMRDGAALEVSLSFSALEAEQVADALMEAIDYVRSAPARAATAAEQAERDKIAGGERPEMHATERGELDGQTQVHPFLKEAL